MVLLIHHPVSAASRKVRIIMAEKRMLFVLKEEEPWKPSQDLYKLNPSGEVPVFVFDGNVIAGNYAITEFLEEVNREIRLMPADPKQKAEVRRLIEWFDVKFMREVNRNIVYEKVHKRFGFGNPQPQLSSRIHRLAGRTAQLSGRRRFFAGRHYRSRTPVGYRLSGRRSVGRLQKRQAVVFENKVAAKFQGNSERQHQRNSSCQTLCKSGLLK